MRRHHRQSAQHPDRSASHSSAREGSSRGRSLSFNREGSSHGHSRASSSDGSSRGSSPSSSRAPRDYPGAPLPPARHPRPDAAGYPPHEPPLPTSEDEWEILEFPSSRTDAPAARSKTHWLMPRSGDPAHRPPPPPDQIKQLYTCAWPECDKSYAVLLSLNVHIALKGHGPRRSHGEFGLEKFGGQKQKEEDKAEASSARRRMRRRRRSNPLLPVDPPFIPSEQRIPSPTSSYSTNEEQALAGMPHETQLEGRLPHADMPHLNSFLQEDYAERPA